MSFVRFFAALFPAALGSGVAHRLRRGERVRGADSLCRNRCRTRDLIVRGRITDRTVAANRLRLTIAVDDVLKGSAPNELHPTDSRLSACGDGVYGLVGQGNHPCEGNLTGA